MSSTRKTQQKIEKLINDYVAEFLFLSRMKPSLASDELALWKSITVIELLKQTIEERARYADYVTKKMCKHDADTVCAYSKQGSFSDDYKFGHPSQIGNYALVILSLPDGKQKQKIEENFNKVAGNTVLEAFNFMLFKSFAIGVMCTWLCVLFFVWTGNYNI